MSDKYEGLGLSEEEIAAMEEELGEDTGVVAEAEETDEVDEDQSTVADDAAEEVEAKADEVEVADEVAPAPEANPEPEPAPAPVVDAVPSALDNLEADLVEVKKKFDDGELSIDEYIDAKSAIDRKIVKAELKAELAQEAASKSWGQSQEDFLGKHEYLRDEVIYGAFATQVNKLLADPKSASMTDEALLAAAKAKVDSAFGRKPAEPEPPKKDESPIRKAKKDAADTSKTPVTLQGIPAAAQADDVDGNRFAYLDRLSGEAFEAAISKLSDDDRKSWLRSQ